MSAKGNLYAVVFMEYLTKWSEVFAMKDMTALTIAKLLVRSFDMECLGSGTSFLSDV